MRGGWRAGLGMAVLVPLLAGCGDEPDTTLGFAGTWSGKLKIHTTGTRTTGSLTTTDDTSDTEFDYVVEIRPWSGAPGNSEGLHAGVLLGFACDPLPLDPGPMALSAKDVECEASTRDDDGSATTRVVTVKDLQLRKTGPGAMTLEGEVEQENVSTDTSGTVTTRHITTTTYEMDATRVSNE